MGENTKALGEAPLHKKAELPGICTALRQQYQFCSIPTSSAANPVGKEAAMYGLQTRPMGSLPG